MTEDHGTHFVVVDVAALRPDLAQGTVEIVLRERGGQRECVVVVAAADGATIDRAWRRLRSPRPSLSELFTNALGELQADVVACRLIRQEGPLFYAELDLMSPTGRRVLDCRPSDGIALALRQAVPAPLLVAAGLLAN